MLCRSSEYESGAVLGEAEKQASRGFPASPPPCPSATLQGPRTYLHLILKLGVNIKD